METNDERALTELSNSPELIAEYVYRSERTLTRRSGLLTKSCRTDETNEAVSEIHQKTRGVTVGLGIGFAPITGQRVVYVAFTR